MPNSPRYSHQPDMYKLRIVDYPDNHLMDGSVTIVSECVCDDANHFWTAVIHNNEWMSSKPVASGFNDFKR